MHRQTLTLCAVSLFMTQCVEWPQVMKVHGLQKSYFTIGLSEHQNARCHFESFGSEAEGCSSSTASRGGSVPALRSDVFM